MTTEREPDAIHRLRDGKRQIREARTAMSLSEKVRQVVRLQAAVLPLIQRRRELGPLERVWPLRDRR